MSKVYRLIVEKASAEVFCPVAKDGCRGPMCAAWFWVNEPRREFVATIDINRAKDSGLLMRNGITGPLANILDDIEAFNALYEKFALINVATDDFGTPVMPDWESNGEPYYDNDEGLWCQKYTRESDPTATGFCGMVGPQIFNDGE
jgi:hypothetical protein